MRSSIIFTYVLVAMASSAIAAPSFDLRGSKKDIGQHCKKDASRASGYCREYAPNVMLSSTRSLTYITV